MRINKFIAQATGMSRRAADEAITARQVTVNGTLPQPGQDISELDEVLFHGKKISLPQQNTTILLHKPVGYVVSRSGQGSKTIYQLLPPELHQLKPVGRLDKDSSGLLLLTNDGQLANQLTHPKYHKVKVYQIELDKPLTDSDMNHIQHGVALEDGVSSLQLSGANKLWTVTMHEGKNRQIRRTFAKLGYQVIQLHRTEFGGFTIKDLNPGDYSVVEIAKSTILW